MALHWLVCTLCVNHMHAACMCKVQYFWGALTQYKLQRTKWWGNVPNVSCLPGLALSTVYWAAHIAYRCIRRLWSTHTKFSTSFSPSTTQANILGWAWITLLFIPLYKTTPNWFFRVSNKHHKKQKIGLHVSTASKKFCYASWSPVTEFTFF